MDEGQQRHQKVFSFLRRVLSQDRYERIRAIEPCVIVANGFNKAFKFVVLGDDRLYITENPPKLAKDVRIVVDLASVTDIEIVSMVFVLKLSELSILVIDLRGSCLSFSRKTLSLTLLTFFGRFYTTNWGKYM